MALDIKVWAAAGPPLPAWRGLSSLQLNSPTASAAVRGEVVTLVMCCAPAIPAEKHAKAVKSHRRFAARAFFRGFRCALGPPGLVEANLPPAGSVCGNGVPSFPLASCEDGACAKRGDEDSSDSVCEKTGDAGTLGRGACPGSALDVFALLGFPEREAEEARQIVGWSSEAGHLPSDTAGVCADTMFTELVPGGLLAHVDGDGGGAGPRDRPVFRPAFGDLEPHAATAWEKPGDVYCSPCDNPGPVPGTISSDCEKPGEVHRNACDDPGPEHNAISSACEKP